MMGIKEEPESAQSPKVQAVTPALSSERAKPSFPSARTICLLTKYKVIDLEMLTAVPLAAFLAK